MLNHMLNLFPDDNVTRSRRQGARSLSMLATSWYQSHGIALVRLACAFLEKNSNKTKFSATVSFGITTHNP